MAGILFGPIAFALYDTCIYFFISSGVNQSTLRAASVMVTNWEEQRLSIQDVAEHVANYYFRSRMLGSAIVEKGNFLGAASFC